NGAMFTPDGVEGDSDVTITADDGINAPVSCSQTVNVANDLAPYVVDTDESPLGTISNRDAFVQTWRVSDLVSITNSLIGDDDNGVQGMVLIDADTTTLGSWQYSLNGTTWNEMPSDLSNSNGLVMALNSYVRFIPTADGISGESDVAFRVWD